MVAAGIHGQPKDCAPGYEERIMMKDRKTHSQRDDCTELLSELQEDPHVQEMKHFIQHGKVSTYEHCEQVARLSYEINRRLSLHADLKTLLTGAMLHDFFLYDWHADDGGAHRLHGFTHPESACRNAKKNLNIDDDTAHVIRSHMWPLTLRQIPSSREAWIVCLADKYVSLQETLFKR